MTSIPLNAAAGRVRGGAPVSDVVSDDEREVTSEVGWYGVHRVVLSEEPDTAVLPW
jgi:hypothetical protein